MGFTLLVELHGIIFSIVEQVSNSIQVRNLESGN